MQYYSIPQTAKKLGVSRIAIYKKVKNGSINAVRVGRSYAIVSDEISKIFVRGRKHKDSKKHTMMKPNRVKKNTSIIEEEKQNLSEIISAMKPRQRLLAYYNHNFHIYKMYLAGFKRRKRVKS